MNTETPIMTANFWMTKGMENAVSISIGLPRGWSGKRYLPLAPDRAWLGMSKADYDRNYGERLIRLDAGKVVDELLAIVHPHETAILLCWEPFNVACHRRYVAEWIEASLGIEVPELGHDRHECLPYDDAPDKEEAKQNRHPDRGAKTAKKEKTTKDSIKDIQGFLF